MPAVKPSKFAAVVVGFSMLAAACSGDSSSASMPTDLEPLPPVTAQTSTTKETVTPAITSEPALSVVPLATLPQDANLCDSLGEISTAGALTSNDLVETSGIVASRAYDVLWAHNDSGHEPTVYALDLNGTVVSTHRLDGVFPLDWEDIAIGPGPSDGLDYLYVGDIGDNLNFRTDVIVYRIPEPVPGSDAPAGPVERILLVYPEPGVNSEAMMVDPVTGDIYLIAKTVTDPVTVYRAEAELLSLDHPTSLIPVATLGIEPGTEVTAADITMNGDRVALRGYEAIWVWPRFTADLAEVLSAEPCLAASPEEVQGEALALTPTGGAIYTISEGSGAKVNRVEAP